MESAADYLFANSPLPVSPPRRTRRGGWKPRRPLQSRPSPNCSRQPRQSHLISTKADIQISRKHSTPWRANRGVLEARATFSAAKLPFFTRLSHSASWISKREQRFPRVFLKNKPETRDGRTDGFWNLASWNFLFASDERRREEERFDEGD